MKPVIIIMQIAVRHRTYRTLQRAPALRHTLPLYTIRVTQGTMEEGRLTTGRARLADRGPAPHMNVPLKVRLFIYSLDSNKQYINFLKRKLGISNLIIFLMLSLA